MSRELAQNGHAGAACIDGSQASSVWRHGFVPFALQNAVEGAGFDLMITADQNLEYQQNLERRQVALIVLGAGNWPVVHNHVGEIIAAVDAATPASYTFIKMPLPPKPPYTPP